MTIMTAGPSRLVVHVVGPSQLIPLVSQPAFSPSLTHLIAHPPVLLNHLASEYLTPPPPPGSPSPKFWSVFLPVSERPYESERLVFGAGSEGSGGNTELAVEVLVRGDVEGSGRRRGVERVLEGWSGARGGACDLTSLESLKNIWTSESTDKVFFYFPPSNSVLCYDTLLFPSLRLIRRKMFPSISILPLLNSSLELAFLYHMRMKASLF